jgi:DNA-binding LacI/PurR family transcriptional regulator
MRDVAQKAGVSINTVSRVVNGYGEVSEATGKRVMAAIEELGFRPNALARSLVSGKSLSVAFIIPQITDPFYPDVILGVESIARQRGYSVFLCNTNNDPQQELEYVDVLAAKQVDGIILCGSRMDADQLSQVAAQHPVAILTSRTPRSAAVVSIRGEPGLFNITSHLIRLGHRKIGHIGWPSPNSGGERANGYARALREHGLVMDPRWLSLTKQATIEAGRDAGRDMLAHAPELTAISCFNDLVAIGVMQACADLGRRVPDDIAIVGFDDIPLASLVTPGLTTMHIPRFQLGEIVMELMLRVIAANGNHEELLYIDPEIVVRESCGAHRHPLPLASTLSAGKEVTSGQESTVSRAPVS